jgi:hypothetical protein
VSKRKPKRRLKTSKSQRGKPGPRGAPGERGERGEQGSSAPLDVIDRLTTELGAAQRELRVQFTRIAQLQADLDQVRADAKSRP